MQSNSTYKCNVCKHKGVLHDTKKPFCEKCGSRSGIIIQSPSLIDSRNKNFTMGLEEPKSHKIIRIASYVFGLGLMLAFFIFLSTNWRWMIDHNGTAFTVAMLLLAIATTTATIMHMFNFNLYQWIMARRAKKNK